MTKDRRPVNISVDRPVRKQIKKLKGKLTYDEFFITVLSLEEFKK